MSYRRKKPLARCGPGRTAAVVTFPCARGGGVAAAASSAVLVAVAILTIFIASLLATLLLFLLAGSPLGSPAGASRAAGARKVTEFHPLNFALPASDMHRQCFLSDRNSGSGSASKPEQSKVGCRRSSCCRRKSSWARARMLRSVGRTAPPRRHPGGPSAARTTRCGRSYGSSVPCSPHVVQRRRRVASAVSGGCRQRACLVASNFSAAALQPCLFDARDCPFASPPSGT